VAAGAAARSAAGIEAMTGIRVEARADRAEACRFKHRLTAKPPATGVLRQCLNEHDQLLPRNCDAVTATAALLGA
jgi:hypothetical protein